MIEWEIQFITDIHDVTTTSARTPVAAAASGRRLRKQSVELCSRYRSCGSESSYMYVRRLNEC